MAGFCQGDREMGGARGAHFQQAVKPPHPQCCNGLVPYAFVALFATLAILGIALAWTGSFPFGDRPFVARDGVLQYVGFHGWYHRVLMGQDSLFYSFAKGLGGGTFALFTYYLSSPLALLSLFVRPSHMAQALSVFMVVKICLAAFTCSLYVMKRTGGANVAVSLWGVCYALGSWTFADGQNIMWIDGLIMLPLVALAVWQVARGDSPFPLMVACAASILFNWYTAYMLCLFSIPYFFVELACCSERGKRLRATITYACAMAIAVMMGAVILLPVGLAQVGSGSVEGGSWFLSAVSSSASPLSIIDLLHSMVDVSRDFAGQGNSVCVPVPMLCAAALASASYAPRRLKYGLAIIVAMLVVAFLFKPFDMIWTGFVRADSYNPRYAFLFTLVLCLCASWTTVWLLSRSEDGKPSRVYWVRSTVAWGLTACSLAGSFYIAVASLSTSGVYGYASNSICNYEDYMEAVEDVVDRVESNDGGFYRIGTAFGSSAGAMTGAEQGVTSGALPSTMTTGQDMAMGVSSLAHYSSTASGSVKQLLGHLGYCTLPGTRGITSYQDPLFLTDSLFGVRYVLDTGRPAECSDELFSFDLPSPYDQKAGVYLNPYALPIGYGVCSQADDVDWTDDPFDNQEALLSSLLGQAVDNLYTPASVSLEKPNQGETEGGALRFRITAAQDGPLYMRTVYLSSPVLVYADGELLQSSGNFEFDNNVMYLGDYQVGEYVEIVLEPTGGTALTGCQLEAQTLNVGVAKNALSSLGRHALNAEVGTGGSIEGTVNLDEDEKLLLTIPVESGWTARVDGAEVEVEDLNGLIALEVPSGEHAISLTYETPGLKTGAVLSLAGIAFAITWSIFMGMRHQAK